MEEFTIYGIALVPIITGMVELLKKAGIPKRYSPVISLILGLLAGFYYLAPGDTPRAVLLGLVVGLSAIGLYSGTKNTIEELKNNSGNNSLKKTSRSFKNKNTNKLARTNLKNK